MLKSLSTLAAFAVLAAAAAVAEPQVTPPSAAQTETEIAVVSVDTMTCEQMQAEMMIAGQRMHSQLDPQFGVEANAMAQEAQQKQRQAMQQAFNPMCFIPIVGMACAAQQQQQAQQSQQDAAANQQRMQAQMDRLNTSMNGIDQDRMRAINNRFVQMRCPMPAQSPQEQH